MKQQLHIFKASYVSLLFFVLSLTQSCTTHFAFELKEGRDFQVRSVPAGSFQLDTTGIIMTITKGYLMAQTEVTQELWEAVMWVSENNLSPSGSVVPADGVEIQEKRPVENVSWYDAIEFCNRLSEKTGRKKVYIFNGSITRNADGSITDVTGVPAGEQNIIADFSKNGYRLPIEMEWMWAAMGANYCDPTNGYDKQFAGISGSTFNDNVWYGNAAAPANGKTHQVGQKGANELDLYDMSGNVWEICWDGYGTQPSVDSTDYRVDNGTDRVRRGGSWMSNISLPNQLSVAYRHYDPNNTRVTDLGFRFVRNR